MKNLMFLLLCLPGVAALTLAFFKVLRRQWLPERVSGVKSSSLISHIRIR
jgi:hypothetical protein